ncbi:MFS transporter [Phenylobacterium sp.]|uniref:MFS transporter n=1 Tax=Phenylobacterium sp. TaxID=1871053 RepID=UPI00271D354F|nr:MFS transporter [Phenylobacterium sp.]MDO8380726.1 MFS transporter [Phenylobacterium sp.]
MTAAVAKRLSPGFIVAICFCIAALEGYDIQAFGVSAPHMAPELHLNPGQMGWAGSAAMIGLVIGALTGGWFADRVGRKPVLAVSVAAFGIFSVATAFANSFETLTIARLLTGIGFGGAMPNLIAIATEISTPAKRAATTTSMFCGLPAGGSLVALLASNGGEALDWRTIFLIGGALPLLLTPVVLFLLPETRPEHDPAADRGLAKGLFSERRALTTLLIWLVFGLDLLVTYLLLNWLPTLVVAKGFTAADGAATSLYFNVFSVVGALILGWLADRVGFRWPLLAVFLVLAGAMYGLAQSAGLPAINGFAALAGFTVVGGLYVLYALAPIYYPVQVRAAGAGAAIAVGRLGSIAGPLIAGELRGAGYSADQVFLSMVPVVLVGAVAVFALMSVGRPVKD